MKLAHRLVLGVACLASFLGAPALAAAAPTAPVSIASTASTASSPSSSGEAIALKEVFVNVRIAHPSVIADLERLFPEPALGGRPGDFVGATEALVRSGPF